MDETCWHPSFELISGLRSKIGIVGGAYSADQDCSYIEPASTDEFPSEDKLARLTMHYCISRIESRRVVFDICMIPEKKPGCKDSKFKVAGTIFASATLANGGVPPMGGAWDGGSSNALINDAFLGLISRETSAAATFWRECKAVLPVSIALDFARSKVMTKLSSHIEKASLQIQKLVARRKKVEQHDVNHEEVISRSGTSHITAYQWNSLAKQVFEKRSWQKALASFRMYLNWLYYQDILGVGIECALARMMELGRISSADIGVYASVIEDSIDLLLTRYREESRLAQMETHRDKLLELSEALDNVRSRLRGGAGSRIQSLCKVDSSSRFLELRDFECAIQTSQNAVGAMMTFGAKQADRVSCYTPAARKCVGIEQTIRTITPHYSRSRLYILPPVRFAWTAPWLRYRGQCCPCQHIPTRPQASTRQGMVPKRVLQASVRQSVRAFSAGVPNNLFTFKFSSGVPKKLFTFKLTKEPVSFGTRILGEHGAHTTKADNSSPQPQHFRSVKARAPQQTPVEQHKQDLRVIVGDALTLRKLAISGAFPDIELVQAICKQSHGFSTFSLANIAMSFAIGGRHDHSLFTYISQMQLRLMSLSDARSLANIAWAFAKIGRIDSKLFDALAAAALCRISEYTERDLANTAWAFATSGIYDRKLLAAVMAATLPSLSKFDQRELSNIAWAFAKAAMNDRHLFDALAEVVTSRVGMLIPQGLTNIAWAFATVGGNDRKLFHVIVVAALPKLVEFNPRNLSNVVWAFVKAGRNDDRLFDAVAAAAVPRIPEFIAQGLTNLVWAYATAKRADPALFNAAAVAVPVRIGESDPQNLSNIVWAFSKVGRDDCSLFDAVAFAAVQKNIFFSEQHLSITSWAFAKAGRNDPELFHAVAVAVLPTVCEFTPHGLSNLAWAFAKAGRNDRQLFEAVARATSPMVREFTPHGLANIMWAYVTIGRNDPKLLDAVAGAAFERIGEFDPQNLSSIAWVFAKAGRNVLELFDAMASQAIPSLDQFSQHQLGITAWSFVEADLAPTQTTKKLLAAITAHARRNSWTGLEADCAPPSSSLVEAHCAELVLNWIPGATRNRYHQMCFELDAVIHDDGGMLIDLEIDELYHRGQRQRAIDARRDRFLEGLGVRVVRFVAFDESGRERTDLSEDLEALLRSEGLLRSSIAHSSVMPFRTDFWTSGMQRTCYPTRCIQSSKYLQCIQLGTAHGAFKPLCLIRTFCTGPRRKLFTWKASQRPVGSEAVAERGGCELGALLTTPAPRRFQLHIKAQAVQHAANEQHNPHVRSIIGQALRLRNSAMRGELPNRWLVQQVADDSLEAMDMFRCNQLSMLTTVSSVAFREHDLLWKKLAVTLQRNIGGFDGSSLANIAWNFAIADRSEPHLFDHLASAALPRMREFTPQELSNVLFAFARSRILHSELFDAVEASALHRIGEFNAQGVANLVWACATIARHNPVLFNAVAVAALGRIKEFHARELAIAAWAFAKSRNNSSIMFDAISVAASSRISEFTSKGLSKTVWAFASVSRKDPKLFSDVKMASLKRISEFTSQGLSNVAWAFATIARYDPDLFDAVAAAALQTMSHFNEQELANTAWAFAKSKKIYVMLFDAVAVAAQQRMHEFTPQGLSNLVWAFATFARNDPMLFTAVKVASVQSIRQFSSQSLSNLVWAFATMAMSDKDLFDAVALAVLQRIHHFSRHDSAMMVWAFVQADLIPTQVTNQLFNTMSARARQQNWTSLDANRGPQKSGTIEARCSALVLQLIPGATRNRYHQMGFELDIVIESEDGTLFDVEIDELYHRGERQRGIDARRDTFLEGLGVRVVRFDAFDEFGHEREGLILWACSFLAFGAVILQRLSRLCLAGKVFADEGERAVTGAGKLRRSGAGDARRLGETSAVVAEPGCPRMARHRSAGAGAGILGFFQGQTRDSNNGFLPGTEALRDPEVRMKILYGARYFNSEGLPVLLQTPDGEVVKRGDKQWQYWKFVWRSSLVTGITLTDHLHLTHFRAANLLARSSRARVPAAHPIRRFMSIFTFGSIFVNMQAMHTLVGPNHLLHRATPFKNFAKLSQQIPELMDDLLEVPAIKALVNESAWEQLHPTLKALPFYADARLLVGALRNLVRNLMVQTAPLFCTAAGEFQPGTSAFRGEMTNEIQEAHYKIDAQMLRPDLSCSEFMEIYEKRLHVYLFMVTGWHRQVGFVGDYYGDPSLATMSWKAGEAFGRPRQHMIMTIVNVFTSTSQPLLDDDYTHLFKGMEPDLQSGFTKMWQDFRAELQEVTKEIDRRNEKRQIKNINMSPRVLAGSVSK
ncbi:unnamed protein product [Polarella glacialis]|uniref:RAP domain-containing protein n=1 Tax=Polarella glacialis TaxID=89957 RepID=A0A813DEB1_POLGL|nr:unnamed protein product [Polarella glacialis]